MMDLLFLLLKAFFLGIVIKYETMTYKEAVHHAHLVLSLCSKASRYVRDLLDAPDVSLNLFLNNSLLISIIE